MSEMRVRGKVGPLRGTVEDLPGDKSIGHRALLFSAMSDGEVADVIEALRRVNGRLSAESAHQTNAGVKRQRPVREAAVAT